MRIFAHLVSLIFNPLVFLFVLPYLLVIRLTDNPLSAIKWQALTVVFLAVLIALFLIGMRRGVFSDFDVSRREERPRFYFVTLTVAVIYLSLALFLRGPLFPLSLIAFGVCVAIVAFAIVNYRLKASGHVAVASAFVLTMGVLYGPVAFGGIFWIIPLVAWSRVYLRRHTASEVIVGGLIGSAITAAVFFIGTRVNQ